MKEVTGDLWKSGADIILVPTNLTVTSSGHAVMGAGVARQCKRRYPEVTKVLGLSISAGLLQPVAIHLDPVIYSFPTKYHYKNGSDKNLIRHCAWKFSTLCIDGLHRPTVALPRIGCGLGGLDWETQVKPILECYFDDNYTVYTLV